MGSCIHLEDSRPRVWRGTNGPPAARSLASITGALPLGTGRDLGLTRGCAGGCAARQVLEALFATALLGDSFAGEKSKTPLSFFFPFLFLAVYSIIW
jgi:hypothetical protein